MKKLDAHVFICTNSKESGVCCAARGSKKLRDELKALSKERFGTRKAVRINNSGCLGHCENGIVGVIYPQGQWLSHLKSDDAVKVLGLLEKVLK